MPPLFVNYHDPPHTQTQTAARQLTLTAYHATPQSWNQAGVAPVATQLSLQKAGNKTPTIRLPLLDPTHTRTQQKAETCAPRPRIAQTPGDG